MFPNEVSDSLQNKMTTTTSEPKQYVSGQQSYKPLCTILVLYFFFVLELTVKRHLVLLVAIDFMYTSHQCDENCRLKKKVVKMGTILILPCNLFLIDSLDLVIITYIAVHSFKWRSR